MDCQRNSADLSVEWLWTARSVIHITLRISCTAQTLAHAQPDVLAACSCGAPRAALAIEKLAMPGDGRCRYRSATEDAIPAQASSRRNTFESLHPQEVVGLPGSGEAGHCKLVHAAYRHVHADHPDSANRSAATSAFGRASRICSQVKPSRAARAV